MANDIVCENSKIGNPASEWDVVGGGDTTIQGFATDISVNRGETVLFKISTNASAYTINIYRLGYYGGVGARKIATVSPSATLPQSQPACVNNAAANFVDCGNWAVSASWTVPSNATSGVYIARLVRGDTGGSSHVVFIVRNDSSHSDILFQTSDESWQAYNNYGAGGFSLYGANGWFDLPNRGLKVSYNRPFITRGFSIESATWVFGVEFPMIQWLEQNGYDVTYFTGVDAARNGALIKNHKLYTSTGHDEYWSGPHRTNVEAARDASVNLAFFSGNEVFWKTRWENSIDGSNTAYRTLVCYKETLGGAKTDPTSTWTGTWRDPRFTPPADGGKPENSLTGTIFTVNGVGPDNDGNQSIKVPAADGKMRFWRNTAIASLGAGQTYTLPLQTLGYEWDEDLDNGARPAGAFQLSTSTYTLTVNRLLDYGATYGAGTATHHLMMYRAASGALVFGAGTVAWAWGLNKNHDDPFGPPQDPDVNMQQATVNLFADMGVQPVTLQGGLLLAQKSTDTTPPISTITSPATGSAAQRGVPVTVTGTATDSGGGVVGGVEVSSDGGQTWHPATGRQSWTYIFTPLVSGPFQIMSRAVDDSGNLEAPGPGVTISVPLPAAGIDAQASGDSTSLSSTVQTSAFSTSAGNELLLAFVATDYRSGPNTTVSSVNGGGLTWVLVVRTNAQFGTSEIWRTFTPSPLSNVTVTATLSQAAMASITVTTFIGVDISGTNGSGAIGATKSASAPSGAPTASLVTTRNNSWVLGVGNDFDNAIARTLGPGQNLLHQYLTPAADTYWVQMQSSRIPSSGTSVTINDTAPTGDQYNLSIVEVLSPAGGTLFGISGTVSPSSAGSGTLLTLSGPASGSTATDSSGNYSFPNLGNGTYTVTPSKAGYTFTPASQTVTINGGNATSVNFTAAAVPTYVISGTVSPSSIGSGTLLTLSGTANATLTGDSSGNYSFTGLSNGTYTVTPSRAGYTFSPTNRTVTINGASATAINFTGAVVPTFAISGTVSPSSAGSGTVLTLSGTSSATVTADSLGNFSFAGLQNGSYTVTPNKALFAFTPANQQVTINGGNVAGVNFAAASGERIFTTQTPVVTNGTDGPGVNYELGTVFTSGVAGQITAIRFWKASNESGSHTGRLWTATGQLLATVIFSGETASGWQQQNLTTPVSITANTTYVVTVNTGSAYYVATTSGLATSVVNGNLRTLVGNNGVYGTPGQFPMNSYQNSNYFRDVLFVSAPTYTASGAVSPAASGAGTTLTLSGAGTGTVAADASGNYTFSGLANGSYTVTPSKAGFTFNPTSLSFSVSGTNVTGLNFTTTTLTYSLSGAITPATAGGGATVTLTGAANATVTADASGNYTFSGLANGSYTVTPAKTGYVFTPSNQAVTISGANTVNVNFTGEAGVRETIFTTQTPVVTNGTDGPGVNYELGTVFTSGVAGQITAIRFWKASNESGSHTGRLWTATGQLLATVIFSGETVSGWQQQNLTTPVSITANTTYVVTVNTGSAYYVATNSGLATSVVNGNLRTLVGNNGVYGTPGQFPTNSYQNSNYFRDVVLMHP
jgi:hypothetical protein